WKVAKDIATGSAAGEFRSASPESESVWVIGAESGPFSVQRSSTCAHPRSAAMSPFRAGFSSLQLFLFQVVLLKEPGPKRLRRNGNVRPPLRGKVHEIPVRPHRIDVISLQLRSPEMKNPSIAAHEDMHDRQLHVVGLALALVVGLKGRFESRGQRNLRPPTLPRPRVDFFSGGLGDCDKRGVATDLVPGSIESIDERRTGETRVVPVRPVHERVQQ